MGKMPTAFPPHRDKSSKSKDLGILGLLLIKLRISFHP